jgi:hypothetical protein
MSNGYSEIEKKEYQDMIDNISNNEEKTNITLLGKINTELNQNNDELSNDTLSYCSNGDSDSEDDFILILHP